MDKLRIVTPVYNDWASFRMLLQELDKVAAASPFRIFVTAVDDGSIDSPEMPLVDPDNSRGLLGLQHLQGAEIVHLSTNVGHQRAIAVGLCAAADEDDFDALVIMDADGEDPPVMISHLLDFVDGRTDFCIVAQRRKRTEKLSFKLSYLIYKYAFALVTGKRISFGNFSLLSRSYVRRVVMISDLWNNLPAAILRSRLPIQRVPVDRGHRYAGKSKMNFTSLVVHGLSGISVYAETIFVRLLLLTVGISILSALAIASVLTLRLFFPAHATPGWATTVSFGMVIILLQVFFTTLSSILMLLNSRVQRLIIPISDYRPYVAYSELLFGSPFSSLQSVRTSDRVS